MINRRIVLISVLLFLLTSSAVVYALSLSDISKSSSGSSSGSIFDQFASVFRRFFGVTGGCYTYRCENGYCYHRWSDSCAPSNCDCDDSSDDNAKCRDATDPRGYPDPGQCGFTCEAQTNQLTCTDAGNYRGCYWENGECKTAGGGDYYRTRLIGTNTANVQCTGGNTPTYDCLDFSADPNDYAWCDDETDCVYSKTCVDKQTRFETGLYLDKIIFCSSNGKWRDCDVGDYDGGQCEDFCNLNWVKAGWSDVGEYYNNNIKDNPAGATPQCCGDDANEYYTNIRGDGSVALEGKCCQAENMVLGGNDDRCMSAPVPPDECSGSQVYITRIMDDERSGNDLPSNAFSADTSDSACCNEDDHCVKDGNCYDSGAPEWYNGVKYTIAGENVLCQKLGPTGEKVAKWSDCDRGSYACEDGCGLNYVLSGERTISYHGEYDGVVDTLGGLEECCGDDDSEVYEYCELASDPQVYWSSGCTSSDKSCCSSAKCVHPTNGNCLNIGSYVINSGYTTDKEAYCNGNGRWKDLDYVGEGDGYTPKQKCELLSGNYWVTAGEANVGEYSDTATNMCCGDDSNEYVVTEICPGAPIGVLCCNSASDMIKSDGTCGSCPTTTTTTTTTTTIPSCEQKCISLGKTGGVCYHEIFTDQCNDVSVWRDYTGTVSGSSCYSTCQCYNDLNCPVGTGCAYCSGGCVRFGYCQGAPTCLAQCEFNRCDHDIGCVCQFGEADCSENADCESGLICGQDIAEDFGCTGKPSFDVCVECTSDSHCSGSDVCCLQDEVNAGDCSSSDKYKCFTTGVTTTTTTTTSTTTTTIPSCNDKCIELGKTGGICYYEIFTDECNDVDMWRDYTGVVSGSSCSSTCQCYNDLSCPVEGDSIGCEGCPDGCVRFGYCKESPTCLEQCEFNRCDHDIGCVCSFGEADCYEDADCESGLICGQDIAEDFGCSNSNYDVCVECTSDSHCSGSEICCLQDEVNAGDCSSSDKYKCFTSGVTTTSTTTTTTLQIQDCGDYCGPDYIASCEDTCPYIPSCNPLVDQCRYDDKSSKSSDTNCQIQEGKNYCCCWKQVSCDCDTKTCNENSPYCHEPEIEICDNGLDDDSDGNVDCIDSDCNNQQCDTTDSAKTCINGQCGLGCYFPELDIRCMGECVEPKIEYSEYLCGPGGVCCGPSGACFDSDGGYDIYEGGSMIYVDNAGIVRTREEHCNFNDNPPNTHVNEFHCGMLPNYNDNNWVLCPNGCENGACIEGGQTTTTTIPITTTTIWIAASLCRDACYSTYGQENVINAACLDCNIAGDNIERRDCCRPSETDIGPGIVSDRYCTGSWYDWDGPRHCCCLVSASTTTTIQSTTTTQLGQTTTTQPGQTTTTTTTTIQATTTTQPSGQFTVSAFDCSETFTGSGIHECYIQYNSNVNAWVVFLFINEHGDVVNAPIPYAPDLQTMVGAELDCNSQTIPSGTYHVSYRVYKLNDFEQLDEIAWPSQDEIITGLVC
ncbi:MAG: hypothetical protein ISS48_03400 [Candidatus Aenigmarchaeota archaeon]|nr:hypothetical protein [Candidatus Aenigmarchaeota archaeon]